ncbi:SDR family oxidoreductase [Nonomuraea sp. M3C6]|uniref:SDR family oxidoreductase n=1 Tax=Nonomuraea marmarensis TaxID=3351344 RepID=A0ABW7AA04_9ACTN
MTVAKRILVTGGTGPLGRAVVDRLAAHGHEVRAVSRHAPTRGEPRAFTWMAVDLLGGEVPESVVGGVDTIVHCASGRRGDVEAARNLIAGARRAGGPHLVYISIVGIDRVPFSYYRAKLEVERLIADSGLPWTVQRATQFHDLMLSACQLLARSPVMPVPAATSFQPIDVRDVADHLVELALAAPAGRVPDIGGPQVLSTRELARSYLRAARRYRLVLPVPFPGPVFAGYRGGGQLAPDHAVGRITFEQFLAERAAATGDRKAQVTPR